MTMPTTFARNRVVPWLPGFLDQYPDLEVELLVGDRYADLVEENIDLAIRIGHLTSSSLKVRHLASFETILCASPGYLGKHGIPRTLDDLRQHPCLGLNQPQVWPDWHLRCGDRTATVRVSGKLRFDDGGTMVEAGLNGGGILLVSQWSIGRYLADGRLVRLGQRRSCCLLAAWCRQRRGSLSTVWLRNLRMVRRGQNHRRTDWRLTIVRAAHYCRVRRPFGRAE